MRHRTESDVVLEAYCDEEYGGGNGARLVQKHKPDAILIWTEAIMRYGVVPWRPGLGIEVKALQP